MASIGSRPGTIGPLASQSRRKAWASCTKTRTSLISSLLKPTYSSTGSTGSESARHSLILQVQVWQCRTSYSLQHAPGLAIAHSVCRAICSACVLTCKLARLSLISMESLRSFFQPYRRSDTMLVSSLGTRTCNMPRSCVAYQQEHTPKHQKQLVRIDDVEATARAAWQLADALQQACRTPWHTGQSRSNAVLCCVETQQMLDSQACDAHPPHSAGASCTCLQWGQSEHQCQPPSLGSVKGSNYNNNSSSRDQQEDEAVS